MMINTWNVASIYNYEDAQNHFESTRYPARSKKWFEHQRPLRNTQSPHLRIEKGEHAGVQFYDLVLYSTALVRYFEPNDKGERAVWLVNHYSNSSQRFLWNAGWHARKKLITDAGVEFPLQLSMQSGLAQTLWGDEFTCKLVFNAQGKVIVDKSVHVPFARRVSTTTHRAKRKQLRERLDMIFDMLEMQYQSFISDVVVDEHEGKPFSSRSSGRATQDAIDKLKTADFDNLSPDDMTSLVHFGMESCRRIAHSIVNRRAYNYTFPEQYRNLSWEALREVRMSGLLPCDDKPLSEHSPEVQEALTPTWEDIRKAVELDFQNLAGLHKGDQFKPYPQFAPKVAQSCWSLGGKHEDLPNLFGIETYTKLINRKGVVY